MARSAAVLKFTARKPARDKSEEPQSRWQGDDPVFFHRSQIKAGETRLVNFGRTYHGTIWQVVQVKSFKVGRSGLIKTVASGEVQKLSDELVIRREGGNDADAIREAAEQPDRVRDDRFGGKSWEDRQQHSVGSAFKGSATRNARNVWTIATLPYSEAHFATFPPELAERCIKAGSKPGDTVLDPFAGAFTAPMVADRLQRNAIGIELNAKYVAMARARIEKDAGMFAELSDA